MKRLFFLTVLMFAPLSESLAQENIEPGATYHQVMQAVYKSAGVNQDEVKVTLFTYNYLKAEWHVEITPKKEACIDCYPSFYIKQSNGLKVTKIPHG